MSSISFDFDDCVSVFDSTVETIASTFLLAFDNFFSEWKAWQIVAFTFVLTVFLWKVYNFLVQDEPLLKRLRKFFFKTVRRLPYVGAHIRAEIEKTQKKLEASLAPKCQIPYITRLPDKGLDKENIFKRVEQYERMCEVRWADGRASGAVYGATTLPDLDEITGKVYARHLWSNPLHPDLFPNVQKMEAEVIKMTLELFSGGKDACGNVTSGGTESIMLMVYCYRNWAKQERGIDNPLMIVPHTAHAAFDKAADCFKVAIVHVEEDPVTRKVRACDIERAITRNTILLVVSAPQFPHGAIDPVGAVAALGAANGIPVHVDSCLGGFLLPFMNDVGFPVEPFDFSVDGVTSISVDTHKYGYSPKGTSLILYREKKWRHHQFFVMTDWPGGIYATPTFAGSRPGASIAATWAAMLHVGISGYREATKRILETRVKLQHAVEKVEGLHIEGTPEVCIVAVGSKVFNIFRLSTALAEKGWSLNALQFPPCFHFCLTLMHTQKGVIEDFVKDLQESTTEIMKEPNKAVGGVGAIYGMASTIPDRSIVGDLILAYMDATFSIKEDQAESSADPNANTNSAAAATAVVKSEVTAFASATVNDVQETPALAAVVEENSAVTKRKSGEGKETTPTKTRSRRTTSLDLLYQNIK